MRILIIGGGEIGYALCAALAAEHDVFVVDSDERRAYEQRQRTKAMTRAREALKRIQARVAKGSV